MKERGIPEPAVLRPDTRYLYRFLKSHEFHMIAAAQLEPERMVSATVVE